MSAPNDNDEAPNNNEAPNEEDNDEAAREEAEQRKSFTALYLDTWQPALRWFSSCFLIVGKEGD